MAQPLAMVVDDSPIVLKFATTIVEKLGYRVCTASDGLQALALLAEAENDFNYRIGLKDLQI
jgi:CheY-like chemotaxis protein